MKLMTTIIIASLAGAGGYVSGQQSIKAKTFDEFTPRFSDASSSDNKCVVLVERDDSRLVYRGCWASHIVEASRATWKTTGQPFPYWPIAEFNRETDPLDLDPRY
jgi:hypothetical protein